MTRSRFAGLIALGVGVCLLVGERTVRSQVVLDDFECVGRKCDTCIDWSGPVGYCIIDAKSFDGCVKQTGKKCNWISDTVYCPGTNYIGGSCASQTGMEDDTGCYQTSAKCIP